MGLRGPGKGARAAEASRVLAGCGPDRLAHGNIQAHALAQPQQGSLASLRWLGPSGAWRRLPWPAWEEEVDMRIASP